MTNSVSHVKKTQIKLSERQRHHLSSLVPSFVCSLRQRLSQCCERFTSTAGFSGMWTLNNKGRYNLEKFRKRRERLLAEEQPGDLEVIWL